MTYELPYLTPEKIAERWGCPVSTVAALLRERRLRSVPLLAAIHNKSDVRCELTQDFRAVPGVWESYPGEWVVPVYYPDRPENKATPEQALEHAYSQLRDLGDLDPVVLLTDVVVFEQDRGHFTGAVSLTPKESGNRGPKSGTRDSSIYKVIAGLALANGYRPTAKKQAQGWRDNIVRALEMEGIPVDPDRITAVIREAFQQLKKP